MQRNLICFLTFITIFGLILPIYSQTQTGIVTGYAIDSQGVPISDLHVVLRELNRGSVTDSSGFFIFKDVPAGTYTLILDHIAFTIRSLPGLRVKEGGFIALGRLVLKERVLDMGDIVVSATRTDRRLTEISNSVNIVPETVIQERNAKTTSEALREETGVFVQKTSHGGGSVNIRGLSSNQVLLLVDGIRMNNSTYRLGNHQYLTTIDNSMLHRLEVVRGPMSVLYGSDAMGGTVNAITQIPRLTKSGWNVDYHLLSRYATADEERMARAELGLQSRVFSVQTGFSYKKYNDLRRGKYSQYPEIENATNGLKQTPSGFSAYDFDAKCLFTPSNRQSFVLAYQLSRKIDVPRYDKYENDGYYHWMYRPQNRDLVYLTYENNFQNGLLSSMQMTASFHRQEEGREIQKTQEMLLEKERDDVRTLGFSIQVHSLLGNHFFTAGSDMYFDVVSSERKFIDTKTGNFTQDYRGRYPDDSRYNSYGFFIQDEIRFLSRWTIVPGVRYSLYSTRFNIPKDPNSCIMLGDFQQDFHAFTGSLGLIRKIGKHVFLNANIGQAFRAPNLSDIARLGQSKGSVYEVPNHDLEPEKVLSFDLGLKIDSPLLSASIAAYYSSIRDILASVEATYEGFPVIEILGVEYKVKSKQNVGRAAIRGFEASLKYFMNRHVTFHANISTAYGQNNTINEPVGKIPPTFGLFGFRWSREKIHFDLYLRFASRQDRLSADDLDDPRIPAGGTPGWQTVNFRAGFPVWSIGKIQVAVENIFDVNYREHGSGVNGPGRNVIIGLEVSP
ncbi:TonB-dependent receptor domain-containing protein [bacterium]